MGTLIALPEGNYNWYDTNVSGVPIAGPTSVTVAALTAGTISPASPTVGQTLSVTGSNAPPGAAFLWEISTDAGVSYANAGGTNNAATYNTTGQPAGLYRRRTTLVNGAVATTAAVTLAVGGISVTEVARGTNGTDNIDPYNFTVNLSTGSVPAGGDLVLVVAAYSGTTDLSVTPTINAVSCPILNIGAVDARHGEPAEDRFRHIQIHRMSRDSAGTGASTTVALSPSAPSNVQGMMYVLLHVRNRVSDTALAKPASFNLTSYDLSLSTVSGGAVIAAAIGRDADPSFSAGVTAIGSAQNAEGVHLIVGAATSGVTTQTRTVTASTPGTRTAALAFSMGA